MKVTSRSVSASNKLARIIQASFLVLSLWSACAETQEFDSLLRGSMTDDQDHRELNGLRCSSRTTKGDALYNAVIKVMTVSPASCSAGETNDIENTVNAKFDSIINTNRNFRNTFRLDTGFCRNRRRLAEGQNGTIEEEEELLEDDSLERYHEEMEELTQDENGLAIVEDEFASDQFSLNNEAGNAAEGWTEEERKLSLLVVRISSRGKGKCYLCNPENRDRRRLVDDETFFYRETNSMEREIERQLTTTLKNKYHYKRGHCLKGKNPKAEVHLIVVGSAGSQTKCNRRQDVYCCAPQRKPWDVCSKSVFGDSWFCHESKRQCEGTCNGMWVNAMNPPTNCLPKWDECTNGGNCCQGSRCVRQSQWYSQCL